MKPASEPWWRLSGGRRRAALSVIMGVQVMAGVFFLGDVIADEMADGWSAHLYLEALVAAALCGGLAVSATALRAAHEQIRSQEQALAAAAGALHDVVEAQFEAWGLTAAERDVGMLALKGLDVGDIAALRGAASGTVRAQLSRVYTKAGVTGRAQFVALFVEDLLAGLPGPG
jgi:DNA-binding CsgD family transcriptional regulator